MIHRCIHRVYASFGTRMTGCGEITSRYPVLTTSARGWRYRRYGIWLDIAEAQQQRSHVANPIAKVANADIFVGGMHT